MSYRITGLPMAPFAPLFAMDDAALASHCAMRTRAAADRGFPCRVSLVDARQGEDLILLNHVSHDVATPFRSSYAIYVRADAAEPEPFVDCTPPVFEGRTLSLRGFDAAGMLREGRLAAPGEADAVIRGLFAGEEIAYIHAHNAAPGCFAARIDRT
jgi:hypothetical protein